MFENFEQHLVTVNGVEIACVAAGDGEPLLMLHGFPQTMALWARIAPRLVERGYRVVCADLRGYGASGKPPARSDLANYGFRVMAQDQLELMQVLGHQRFHLVGHDRGARTAHRLALDHPDAVASVTLMDIVPTAVMLTDLRKEVAQSYWHWFFLAQPQPFPEKGSRQIRIFSLKLVCSAGAMRGQRTLMRTSSRPTEIPGEMARRSQVTAMTIVQRWWLI